MPGVSVKSQLWTKPDLLSDNQKPYNTESRRKDFNLLFKPPKSFQLYLEALSAPESFLDSEGEELFLAPAPWLFH